MLSRHSLFKASDLSGVWSSCSITKKRLATSCEEGLMLMSNGYLRILLCLHFGRKPMLKGSCYSHLSRLWIHLHPAKAL